MLVAGQTLILKFNRFLTIAALADDSDQNAGRLGGGEDHSQVELSRLLQLDLAISIVVSAELQLTGCTL